MGQPSSWRSHPIIPHCIEATQYLVPLPEQKIHEAKKIIARGINMDTELGQDEAGQLMARLAGDSLQSPASPAAPAALLQLPASPVAPAISEEYVDAFTAFEEAEAKTTERLAEQSQNKEEARLAKLEKQGTPEGKAAIWIKGTTGLLT